MGDNLTQVHVTAKRDFIESIVSTRPVLALSEIVWNGFDAGSSKVEIVIQTNDMHGIESIRVADFGYGIDHSKIDALFGDLGESWKKKKYKQNGRALHGKNGKGRFKAFSLGEHVEWRTTYEAGGKKYRFRIVGRLDSIDNFDVTPPSEVDPSNQTGTEVVISNIRQDFKSLRDGSASTELSKIYAAYLTDYPDLELIFDGERVDPRAAQVCVTDYKLRPSIDDAGSAIPVTMSIIEWRAPTDRVLHLCDPNGVALSSLPVGQYIRAPGYEFTAYVKSDLFRELDQKNQLDLAEITPGIQTILASARSKIKTHFRRRIAEQQSEIVQSWKREEIYPYGESEHLAPVEIAERQVFDILAVNVQSYLPSFENADHKSRKFTFLLLAQAIRQNPESVQLIISEVLGLKKNEQDQLAELLSKTSLSSIISSAQIVANRLDFLIGLEQLIFDKETKNKLLERDQLHKILESEAWIFNEEFGLSGSEQRLEEVLDKHLKTLGPRSDDAEPVEVGEGKTGRIDLMLHKVVQPRSGEYDYLIVELKRPSKRIDDEVITQIKKYAMAVAGDERFHGVRAKWTFVAISNQLDNFAKRESNQRGRPRGQVYDDADLNITVWVKCWADVINDARSKLDYLNEQLSYEANRETAQKYLLKAHARFIPKADEIQPAEDDDATTEETSEASPQLI